MIKGIKNEIGEISSDDFLHFLTRNGMCDNDEEELLLNSTENVDKIIKGKFLNWFEIEYSKIEKYIVGKFKDTDDNVYNFLLRKYNYFICSESELRQDKYITEQKKFLEDNPLFGKCITLKDRIPFTPNAKNTNPIKFLQNNYTISIENEKKENFFLFESIYRIRYQQSISKYFQGYKDIRWFVELNNINLGGSYEINLKYFPKVVTYNDTIAFYVDDNNIKNLISNPIDEEEIDISIFSFDIETEHYGSKPDPHKNKISHIGLEWFSKKFKRSVILCNNDMIDDYTKVDDTYKLYEEEDIKKKFYKDFINSEIIHMYMSEKSMLECFNYLLIKEPDVILTFNGHSFDFDYIKKRAFNLLKKPILFSYNILGKTEFRFVKKVHKSSNEIRNINRIDMFSDNNIVFIDIMNYCKTHILGCSSYSLDSISKRLFNNICKFKILKDKKIELYPVENISLKFFNIVLRTSSYCFIDNIPFVITDKNKIISSDKKIYDEDDIEKGYGKSFTITPLKDYYDIKDIFSKEYVKVCLSKDAVDIGNPESYKNYDFAKSNTLSIYCRHDSILCRYIYEIESIYNKISNYATNNSLPQEETLVYKESTNINGNLLKQALKFGYVIYKSENIDTGLFEGGYVHNPKERYFNNPVLCFDFTSLYPTCILEGNLSPDTLVFSINTDDKILYHLCVHKAKTIYKYPDYIIIEIVPEVKKKDIYQLAVFDRRKKGIVPSLLDDGIKKRKEFKNLLKANKDNAIKKNYYDSGQYCCKIQINSVYGLTGRSTFVLGLKTCASACTALGRKTIKYTISLLSESFIQNSIYHINTNTHENNIFNNSAIQKTFNIENMSEKVSFKVIYGDTDSVFIEVVGLIKYNKNNTLDKARKIGKILENIFNNSNIFTNYYTLEFETVYYTFILCKKKKYIGEKFSISENDYFHEELTKGISLIRRDYSEFHKKSIRLIKNKLLENLNSQTGDPETVVKDYFKTILIDTIKKVLSEELYPVHFVVSCNYSGNYKDKNNKTEQLVQNHNLKNKEIVEQGSRFYYAILVDKDFKFDETDTFKKLNWNKTPITNVCEYKHILSVEENFSIPDNKRICIEYYLNKIYKDISQSFITTKSIEEFKKLF